jgi:hypothetical protein
MPSTLRLFRTFVPPANVAGVRSRSVLSQAYRFASASVSFAAQRSVPLRKTTYRP